MNALFRSTCFACLGTGGYPCTKYLSECGHGNGTFAKVLKLCLSVTIKVNKPLQVSEFRFTKQLNSDND